MKELRYTTKAKKDLKKYRNDPRKMRKLYEVLRMLVNDIQLPPTYRAHELKGNFQGCLECHIESDFLLIWIDEESNVVEIVRMGSHAELFGM